MTDTHLPSPADVISFWTKAGPEKWFAKDDSFDQAFKADFWRPTMLQLAESLILG